MQRVREGFGQEGTLTAGLPPTSLRSCKRRKGHQQGQGPACRGHKGSHKMPHRGHSLKASVWASEGPESAGMLRPSQTWRARSCLGAWLSPEGSEVSLGHRTGGLRLHGGEQGQAGVGTAAGATHGQEG